MKLFILIIFFMPAAGAAWMIATAPKRRSMKQVAQFNRWQQQMDEAAAKKRARIQ